MRKKFKKWKEIGISKTDLRQDRNYCNGMNTTSAQKKKLALRKNILRLKQQIKI